MSEQERHAARVAASEARRMSARTWVRRFLITGVLVALVWQFGRMVEQLIVQCGVVAAFVAVLLVVGTLTLAVVDMATALAEAPRPVCRRAGRGGGRS